jgi:Rieske Fe-S protein
VSRKQPASGPSGQQGGPNRASVHEAKVGRRDFLSSTSFVAMAGGLAASYGTFAFMAGRFLYHSGTSTEWMYVAPANQVEPGGSLSFEGPTGLKVVIRRKAGTPLNLAPTADDFVALSSVCPHLGCRVHWEPHHERFFCPCHNGAFDGQGTAIAGPPKAENQHLPNYPLMVSEGLLYIELPVETLGQTPEGQVLTTGPGSMPETSRVTQPEV